MKHIPHVFATTKFKGYVVQATSPDRDRWYNWTKERDADAWIMGLWTKEEVNQLRLVKQWRICLLQVFDEHIRQLREKLQPERCLWTAMGRYSPLEIFDLLGPSAGTCFSRKNLRLKLDQGPAVDFKDFTPQHLLHSPEIFIHAVKDGDPDLQESPAFHRFFIALNSQPSNPVAYPMLSYEVPTLFLRRRLLEHFLYLYRREQLGFPGLFVPFPEIAPLFSGS